MVGVKGNDLVGTEGGGKSCDFFFSYKNLFPVKRFKNVDIIWN